MANTNSELATYKKLTKNKTAQTKKTVNKIIIHHMAAKWTAKQCVDYFYATDKQVSSNYCVGYEGSIGLSVNEKDRAWSTGSDKVDRDAITIEVGNSNTSNWAVDDKAINSLIKLLIDICKRNGIEKLTKGKNLYGHRDFAATICPGDYLYNRLDYIAGEVNKQLSSKTIYRVKVVEKQVGAFGEKSNAESLKTKLETLGCEVKIETVKT